MVEEKVGEKVEEKEVKASGKVELDAETYNALLDRLTELEVSATSKPRVREEVDDLDTLAEEGRRGRKLEEKKELVDLDSMTNTQLAQFVVGIVNEQGGARLNKVEVAVESMRVMREIDKAEVKHDDFWQYEEPIRKIATANPSLSI